MRLRKVKNAEEILLEHNDIVLFNPEGYKGKWHEAFHNNNPIALEIGMGKGKFLIELAKRNPNINYLGLEKEKSVLIRAIEKITNDITNIRFLPVDALLLDQYFQENEINKIYLNFSDPWQKTRHTKRRLTFPKMLDLYHKILNNNSSIEMKTDNRHLFEYSLIEFVDKGFKIENLSLNLHEDKEDIVTTEYEDRFVQKGNPIYYIEVKNGKI